MGTALRDIPLSSYIELRRCAASMPVSGNGVYERIRIVVIAIIIQATYVHICSDMLVAATASLLNSFY